MKQLEIEYKNAISLEVPDLWNRIEAGIDEYEATKKTDNISYIKEETDREKKTDRVNGKKVIAYIGRISAAAACLILAIGAFNLMRGSKNSSEMAASDAPAMADYAASETYDEAPAIAEYAAEAEAEEEYSDSYTTDAAPAQDTASESAVEKDDTASNKDTLSYKNGIRSESSAQPASEEQVILTPIESLMIAAECSNVEAQKILLRLTLAGIDSPTDFVPVEEDLEAGDELKSVEGFGDDTISIRFADEAGKEYQMYCNKNDDGTIEVLAIIRADDSAEMIYKKVK